MIHIKDLLARAAENTSKAKFYHHNRDFFLKYFDSVHQYQALINAGNFQKLEGIIKERSNFKIEETFF